jgi:hypothetical protein
MAARPVASKAAGTMLRSSLVIVIFLLFGLVCFMMATRLTVHERR